MTLRHPITFEKRIAARDFDGSEEVWLPVFHSRAEVMSGSSTQSNTDDAIDVTTSHRLKVRYDRRFKPSYRIRLEDRIFTVEGAVNENERDRYILIDANEVLDG